MAKKKKQLDLSEIGEPIENSLQGSEINELDITNIMNDEMITVQKSIEDIENNIESQEEYDEGKQQENNSEYSQEDKQENTSEYSQEDIESNYDQNEQEYQDYNSDNNSVNSSVNNYSDNNYSDNNSNNNLQYQYNNSNSDNNLEYQDYNSNPVNNLEILHAKQLNTKRELIYKIQHFQNIKLILLILFQEVYSFLNQMTYHTFQLIHQIFHQIHLHYLQFLYSNHQVSNLQDPIYDYTIQDPLLHQIIFFYTIHVLIFDFLLL